MFNHRDPKILEYEGLCLISNSFKNRKWEASEIKLFDEILR